MSIADRIIARVTRRPPDFQVGGSTNPYMNRWWVIPRNKWFNIYLHQFMRDDEDRALHDHPWWSLSWLMRGSLIEVTKSTKRLNGKRGIPAGKWTLRSPTSAHRLVVPDENRGKTWTLFFTGPVQRNWGFHCPKAWVPWQEFVDQRDIGAVGRGCGEHA